jgi:hypothetical protein
MLVYLHQYKEEAADFDDNRTTGESQTEDSVDHDSEDYFGADVEDFEAETWETVEHDGDPIQRRSVSIGRATAVSVPQEPTDEDDPDLPGVTIQVRMAGGEAEYVSQSAIVEVQDEQPDA